MPPVRDCNQPGNLVQRIAVRIKASLHSIPDAQAEGLRRLLFLAGAHERLRGLVDLALTVPHGSIDTLCRQQIRMRPPLDDHALVEHDDLVRPHHGGEPVGDDQRGAVARDAVEGILDFLLGEAVEGRGRLVEQKDRRALEDGSRDCDALLLALRRTVSARARPRGSS